MNQNKTMKQSRYLWIIPGTDSLSYVPFLLFIENLYSSKHPPSYKEQIKSEKWENTEIKESSQGKQNDNSLVLWELVPSQRL